MMPVFQYAARLVDVVDADTYKLEIDLGFRVWFKAPVRVYKFYAPELTTPEGVAAKAAAVDLLAHAKTITVRSRKAESYQRVLADVYVNKQSIADLLIAQGHGRTTAPTKGQA